MIAYAFLWVVLAAPKLFDLETIPLDTPDAVVFVCNADADRRADVLVVEQRHVKAYLRTGARVQAALPEGTTGFDIADVDADGQYEVIAIQAPRVVRIPLAPDGVESKPAVLFEEPRLVRETPVLPAPRVLVVNYDGQVLLAVALDSGVELRTLKGEPAAAFPAGSPVSAPALFGPTFKAWPNSPPQIGPADALEWYVSHIVELGANLPPALMGSQENQWRGRIAAVHILTAGDMPDPDSWPSFALQPQRLGSSRVYFAVDPGAFTTVVAVEPAFDKGAASRAGTSHHPPRVYPGLPVFEADAPPDCTGDGYADLLLWTAPRPSVSVDALVRAAVGASWPVRMGVHPYAPAKNRFEPLAVGSVKLQIPIGWVVSNPLMPLRQVVLGDFDGDKRTDFACGTSDTSVSVWLAASGFRTEPDETVQLPATVSHVLVAADLDGRGKCSVILRGAKACYALLAR